MRLLIVEDDQELANGLVHSMRQSMYAVDHVQTGKAALAACATTTYDIVILDLGLPDVDGVDVLKRMRQEGLKASVIILTARDDLQDRIRGLDAGADDYMSKPFKLGELEARLRALLRRGSAGGTQVVYGGLQFDQATRSLCVNGQEITLTARELAVLETLLKRPGKVVSKSQLLESVYSWDTDPNPSNIEVFISRIRKKLDEAHAGVGVRVLRGLGYRLELDTDASVAESRQ